MTAVTLAQIKVVGVPTSGNLAGSPNPQPKPARWETRGFPSGHELHRAELIS